MEKDTIICGRYEPSLPNPKLIEHKYKRVIREKNHPVEVIRLRRKVSRKFPFKSTLDRYFLNDPHLHWEEVFQVSNHKKLCLNIDKVSMYPDALLNSRFPHPKRLQYFTDNPLTQILNKEIQQGIYCCTLTLKKELSTQEKKWFQNYHYLRYAEAEKSHHFFWDNNKKVKTILHVKDIITLVNFCDIQFHWNIRDTHGQGVQHPLYNEIKETTAKRETSTDELRNMLKFKLVCNCSTQRKTEYYIKNLEDKWRKMYGEPNIKNWEEYREINLVDKSMQIDHPSAIYCLYSEIKSYARNIMFDIVHTAKMTINSNPIRIHTDGLTLDVNNTEEVKTLINKLKNKYILGTKTGNLKAYISDKCKFLGPNVGWIYNEAPFVLFEHIGTTSENPLEVQIIDTKGTKYPYHTFFDYKKRFEYINGNWKFLRKQPHNGKIGYKKTKQNTLKRKTYIYNEIKKELHKQISIQNI